VPSVYTRHLKPHRQSAILPPDRKRRSRACFRARPGKERALSLFKNQKRGNLDAQSTIEDTNTFKLVCKIAEGGMGAVYEATQMGSDGFAKRMAIKTILEDFSNNEEFVEMFIGEAKLVA